MAFLNTIAVSSTWNPNQIEHFLRDTKLPARVSCITGDGYPHIMSLWYIFEEEYLFCSVQKKTLISKWLLNNPVCGFEIAGDNAPYMGVRGRGDATIIEAVDKPVLPVLVDKYLGGRTSALSRNLLSKKETELTLRIKPCWLTSWDYSKRMITTV